MYKKNLPERRGLTDEFIVGLKQFLEFALSNVEFMDGDKIRCPCKKCHNDKFLQCNKVEEHLCRFGFTPNYYNWTSHGEPFISDTFTCTFQKEDKTCSGDRAKAIKEKHDKLELAQRNSSVRSKNNGFEPSVRNDLSLWLEASGGFKSGGRILGMGSLSRAYRVAGTSSTTSPTVTTQIHNLTEEVSHLKCLLMQQDQEINELRRQQNLIMQHLQLHSAPRDDDNDDDDGFVKQNQKKSMRKDIDEEGSQVSGGQRRRQ